MKKILFLSNQLANNFDSGGILYIDIIKEYGEENFTFISVKEPIKMKFFNFNHTQVINQYSFTIPRNNNFLKILTKLPLFQLLYVCYNMARFRNEICNLIVKEKFDAILAPLRGEVLVILPSILKKTKLPLIAMVEDTVEAEIIKFDILYKIKKKSYYNLLSSARSLGVAGESMQEYFKTDFDLESTILRPPHKSFSNSFPKELDKIFNIFFAGNAYAERELRVFIDALEKFSEATDLRVCFYIASHQSFSTNSTNLEINNLGWISQIKLNEYTDKCHMAYLPYRSELRFKHQMKYAFPGKAGFYISNNLPVFFHGPSYSSFNVFLKNHPVGISCDSLQSDDVLSKLNKFVKSASFYLNCQRECQKAFNEVFSKENFEQSVRKFLDVN